MTAAVITYSVQTWRMNIMDKAERILRTAVFGMAWGITLFGAYIINVGLFLMLLGASLAWVVYF